MSRDRCCILSKFYIKPQHEANKSNGRRSCILSKFYIKPQLTHKSILPNAGCILSKFYIKPQRSSRFPGSGRCCILSKFYIKPQPSTVTYLSEIVVSYRNSTSNHNSMFCLVVQMWLYLIEILHQTTTIPDEAQLPRSCILSKFYIKPQLVPCGKCEDCVVSYRNSTSNHNTPAAVLGSSGLYLIEILHQTTTALRP